MRFAQTQIITSANQKGGCGKTSSTVSMAAAFCELGYSVCVVDADPQCNTTGNFGVTQDQLKKEGRFTLADVYLKEKPAIDCVYDFGERFNGRMVLVPGQKGLNTIEARLESNIQSRVASEETSILDVDDMRKNQRYRLRNSLKSLRGKYDVVLIDTPPDLGYLMTTALIAADWFIVPVFPSGYDLEGLKSLTETVEKVRKHGYNPNLRLAGVLLGNYDKTTNLDRQIHELLIRRFGEQLVFKTVISRSVKFRESTLEHCTIFEYVRGTQPADQYLDLVREMINRGQKSKSKSTTNPLPDENAIQRLAVGE